MIDLPALPWWAFSLASFMLFAIGWASAMYAAWRTLKLSNDRIAARHATLDAKRPAGKYSAPFLRRELQSLEEQALTLKRACFDAGAHDSHVELSNAESSIRAAIGNFEAKP